MKKTVLPLLILCVYIICSCFLITATAETACVIRGEKVVSEPNSDVTMNIFIENNPGIGGAELIVSYHEKLTLVKAESGAAFSALSYTPPSQFKNPMVFAWDSLEIADKDIKDGVILTLTFHIAEDATGNLPVNISYESGNIFDKDLKVIDPAVESGCVTAISYLPGDADDNKRINTLDVTKIRRFIVDGRKTDPEGYNVVINLNAADVDSSASINTLDITLIRRYIADGKITDPNGYNVVLKPGKLACNHNMVHTEGKDATCTENGNIEYWQCTSCEKYYADAEGKYEILLSNTVITAGHTFADDWSYDENMHWHDATCEHTEQPIDMGEHSFVNHVCSVCDAVEQVSVTFVDDEGTLIDEQLIPYGTAATTPTAPERLGYLFDGWEGSYDAVVEDVTITAKYSLAYYVSFVDHDGKLLKKDTVRKGESATAYEFTEADAIPEGFNRVGWDTAFDNVTMDLVVTATYARKTYSVSFYMPDGALIETQTVEHGSDAQAPECSDTYFDWATLKMGQFSGWSQTLKNIISDQTIQAQYQDEFAQPVISIDTSDKAASIKLYAPKNCYLYAIDFGFDWSGNISILDCNKNTASNLYKGNDGASHIDYSNKYNDFHYTWTNAAGVKLEGEYTTVLDIRFETDGGQVVNKDVLKLFEECSIIFSTVKTSNMDELETVTPIVVMK